jgi:hypothetical protein
MVEAVAEDGIAPAHQGSYNPHVGEISIAKNQSVTGVLELSEPGLEGVILVVPSRYQP